jgi:hypothetical protein
LLSYAVEDLALDDARLKERGHAVYADLTENTLWLQDLTTSPAQEASPPVETIRPLYKPSRVSLTAQSSWPGLAALACDSSLPR